MARVHAVEPAAETFRVVLTNPNTITLPPDVGRHLDLVTGDTIEITVTGDQATIKKVPTEPPPPARGILREYFTDRDDVQRFIEEERSAWEERLKRL